MSKKQVVDAKILATLAILNKAMEQIDNLIMEDKDVRYTHWRNNIYTITEDIEDKLLEDMK